MNTTTGRYFIENNRECTFATCLKEMNRSPFATMGNRYVIHFILILYSEKICLEYDVEPTALQIKEKI